MILARITGLAVLCGLAALPSRAAGMETWHYVEPEILSTSRFNLIVQGNFRTRNNLGDYYQTRAGPIFKVRLLPRLTAIGGYYFRDSKSARGVWTASHRPFGGAEVSVYRGKVNVSARVLVERFIGDTVPDYTRFREYVRVSMGRKIAPFGLLEPFQTPRGLALLRAQGGVQWKVRPRTTLELGYLHDSYQRWYGQNRQAVFTGVRIHLGTWRDN